jgi:uncharacterized lipoprotein
MKPGGGVFLLALLLGASGCATFRNKSCHEGQAYMKAKTVPPLTIPAGLDAPDTTNALRLPTLNEPAPPPRTGKQPCLDEPPPFKVPQATRTPQA